MRTGPLRSVVRMSLRAALLGACIVAFMLFVGRCFGPSGAGGHQAACHLVDEIQLEGVPND